MRILNPVKRALELSVPASSRTINKVEAERNKLLKEQQDLKKFKNLLPIERGAVPGLKERMREARSMEKISRYPLFKLQCLKWRDKQGLPLLVVYDINSPNFKLSTRASRQWSGSRISWSKGLLPNLPTEMIKCYADVHNMLIERGMKKRRKLTNGRLGMPTNYAITATFEGLIPTEVREQIIKAKKEFAKIFIVAQAPKYQIKESISPVPRRSLNRDPLVIGYDGANYWLIAAFDMTTLEEYVNTTAGA